MLFLCFEKVKTLALTQKIQSMLPARYATEENWLLVKMILLNKFMTNLIQNWPWGGTLPSSFHSCLVADVRSFACAIAHYKCLCLQCRSTYFLWWEDVLLKRQQEISWRNFWLPKWLWNLLGLEKVTPIRMVRRKRALILGKWKRFWWVCRRQYYNYSQWSLLSCAYLYSKFF